MNWLTDTIVRWDGQLSKDLSDRGGVTFLGADSPVRYLTWPELGTAKGSEVAALKNGNWPGIQRQGRRRDPDDFVAAASRQPWVNANGYWISCIHAVRPNSVALLAATPKDGLDYGVLELALVESRVWGGNCILGLGGDYGEALQKGDTKAKDAWGRMNATGKWLTENRALFGHPVVPVVTQVVDSSPMPAELCNLLTRQGATPAVVTLNGLPAPDAERRLAVVVAGIAVPDALIEPLLQHSRAGSSLIVETRGMGVQWWQASDLKLVKKDPDRDFYTLGKGQVIAYHQVISDPSEFALDVIDVVTHKRRALRFWDAPAVVGLMTTPPSGPKALVHLVNYGEPRDYDFLLRAQGVYSAATLLRPGKAPEELKAAKRATTTEVRVPSLHRVAVIAFR